jgi:hypothetical protein
MDSDTAWKSAYSTDLQRLRKEAATARGSAAAVAVLRVTRRASLFMVLLLSLGLWAAIWATVASLASAILG